MYKSAKSQQETYELVTSGHRLLEILDNLAHTEIAALDFETTSLRPEDGRVRITSICNDDIRVVIDHDKCGVAFADVADRFTATTWAVFNAGFEGRWFDHFVEYIPGEQGVNLLDVGYMSKAKLGGRPLSLADMVKRDLDKVRDNKHLQAAGWHKPDLTKEQYDYAFEDAEDTWRLFSLWDEDLSDEQYSGFLVINDCWRGVLEMEITGMQLDVDHHKKLINMWTLRRNAAERVLRQYTPPELIPNLRSKKQLSTFVSSVLDEASRRSWPVTAHKDAEKAQLQLTRAQLRQASFRASYPFSRWLAALMVFNRADKYLSTYGDTLLNKQINSGGIYGRLNIAQAVTGRFSSSSPNLQNIPRNPLVRRSFIVKDGFDMFVADYSGIELRVLAEVSGDNQLKQDVIYGDVHSESAITLYSLDRDDFFKRIKAKDPKAKELRSKAKAFSFQLTYGAGNGALALVLRTTDEEAAKFVARWAQRYPKAYAFRQTMMERMTQTGFLPVTSGRTIYVPRNDRSMPVAANYPIQGAAADVMYRAIKRTHDALCLADFPARLMNTVHDELLSITREGYGEQLASLQLEAMKQGWLDVFPGTSTDNLVEGEVGKSWACKP